MITIWVHKKYLEQFIKVLNDLEYLDEVDTMYHTHFPGKEYVQLLIGYDEFVQLQEKNNV